MGQVLHWFQDHHLLPRGWHVDPAAVSDWVKTQWVILVLLGTGLVALVTAVLVAWPAIAYLGARLFGG